MKKTILQLLAIAITLLCWGSFRAQAQCCPTDSLKINTGYNPMTGSVLIPGVRDPQWIITLIEPSMRADIAASARTAACAAGSTGAAFVIPSYLGVWFFPTASRWVNCFDSDYYFNSHGAATEYWVISRKFSLCDSACVHFRMGVACDNSILWMGISNTPGDTSTTHYS